MGQDRRPIGYMAPGRAPGSPAGSFALSEFDTINPYSGNLNFRLPLFNVEGRGSAGYSVTRSINIKWSFYHQWFGGMNEQFYVHQPQSSLRSYDRSYFTPGQIESRYERDLYSCIPGEGGWYYELRRIVFTRPDGTVHEFVDAQTNGALSIGHCGWGAPPAPDVQRGRVFHTYDGSMITFVSDLPVTDHTTIDYTGYLLFPDGTRYRVENNKIVWVGDHNGNRSNFTYSYQSVASITDSTGREVTFAYDVQDAGQYGLHDRITYKGTNGQERHIRVSYKNLNEVLRYDHTLQTLGQLFAYYNPTGGTSANDLLNVGRLVSAVWLPDGRSFRFYYNSYGELARVELPTGGAYEYDWGASLLGGDPRGLINVQPSYPVNNYPTFPDINRRVLTKRIYPNGGNGNNFDTRITFGQVEGQGTLTSHNTIKTFDSGGNLMSQQKSYFYRNPVPESERQPFVLPQWDEGVEFKTEIFDVVNNASVLKQRIEKSWQACFGARNTETVTTLVDTNQVAKSTSISPIDGTIGIDQFCNPTDIWEYDFGHGAPGAFKRRSHTDFITDPNYTSPFGAHLRNLPHQAWTSPDIYGNHKVSLSQLEYDNYTVNPLLFRSNVIGHDSVNYGTTNTSRGNITSQTKYGNAQNQSGVITVHTQYDMLGNVVKTIDANGNVATISYDDNFGFPDSEARSNTPPSQLNGANTFAYPTSAANALGWTAYSQFDYFTGAVVNVEDINGVISKTLYNDALDRPTQSVSAVGTNLEAQSKIVYDDANRRIETTSDLFAVNDNLIKAEVFFDGLGRTIEKRSYKDGGYVAAKTEFDALGNVKRITNPYRPLLGEPLLWTYSRYDALGRMVEVETPDGAIVRTAYHGNSILVTDQAGRKRISRTNALGNLTDVWEVTEADSDTEIVQFDSSSFYAYRSSYAYNALNNLTTVHQGVQTRSFAYNDLSRLLSATNPESGTIQYQYDNNGNLTYKRDARGVETNYIYDVLNRITNRNYTAPANLPNYQATPNVSYFYDNLPNAKGKLIRVTNGISTTEYTAFDILGRVTSHRQTTDGQIYNSAYAYNLSGALLVENYPSVRAVRNTLDADGDLSLVEFYSPITGSYQTRASNFTYTAAGAVSSMQLGNGLWESTQFNSRLQPTQIALGTAQYGGNVANRLKIEYGYGSSTQNNGNILSQTITVPAERVRAYMAFQEYQYDTLNRIKEAKETISGIETWKQVFDYDRYGNRSLRIAESSTPQANPAAISPEIEVPPTIAQLIPNTQEIVRQLSPAIEPATNQINESQDYEYDAAGNITRDFSGRIFFYDAENKQTEVRDSSNAPIATYFYDGDGKRIKKHVPNGESVTFIYNAAGVLIEERSTTSNALQTSYIYAGSRLLATESTGATGSPIGVSYLTADHLGSPRINTNASGNVTARHDYQPFGEEIARAGSGSDSVRKKFTGYERDTETDLDFAQARYYAKNLGRFNSVDPIMMERKRLTDPQAINLFAYARNNPLKFIDPDGEKYKGTDGKEVIIKREKVDGKKVWVIKSNNASKDLQKLVGLINASGSKTASSQFGRLNNHATMINIVIDTTTTGGGRLGLHEAHDKNGPVNFNSSAEKFDRPADAAVDANGKVIEGAYREATITLFEGEYRAQADSTDESVAEGLVSTFGHEARHDLDPKQVKAGTTGTGSDAVWHPEKNGKAAKHSPKWYSDKIEREIREFRRKRP